MPSADSTPGTSHRADAGGGPAQDLDAALGAAVHHKRATPSTLKTETHDSSASAPQDRPWRKGDPPVGSPSSAGRGREPEPERELEPEPERELEPEPEPAHAHQTSASPASSAPASPPAATDKPTPGASARAPPPSQEASSAYERARLENIARNNATVSIGLGSPRPPG